MRAGPLPKQLDVRLERRDTTALPPEALARLQVINRGKNPEGNYRWVLYTDGRLFMAQHSPSQKDPQTPFDTDLPHEPTQTLPRDVVLEVEKQLRDANFMEQQPYQEEPGTEDGDYYIVTARIDGTEHEVIYDAVFPEPLPYLSRIG